MGREGPVLNKIGSLNVKSPDVEENQGWTAQCYALKDGTSMEEGRRELGEASRVRKTSLRTSDHDRW